MTRKTTPSRRTTHSQNPQHTANPARACSTTTFTPTDTHSVALTTPPTFVYTLCVIHASRAHSSAFHCSAQSCINVNKHDAFLLRFFCSLFTFLTFPLTPSHRPCQKSYAQLKSLHCARWLGQRPALKVLRLVYV